MCRQCLVLLCAKVAVRQRALLKACARTDNSIHEPKIQLSPREWRKAGSNASRIDLSGYASSQHRRFLKAEAEQAPGSQGITDKTLATVE